MLFSIQLLIILICLFYGARKGGIALGLLGGIGLVILVFVFHLQPGKPPVDVMLVIIAVVAASATLQASGGLDVMLQIAEKLLRRNPKYVSIVAPFVTCTLTILCGTGHVVYTILPIIYDVAIKNNIRPERPMAASSIGAQMGIIASPVSVAVVSLVAMLGNVTFDGKHLEFLDLLSITIPSTLLGILAIGIFSWFRGKDLDKDEAFQKFISVPENRQYVYGDTATLLDKKLPKSNWLAMWIFLAAIAVVALLGADSDLRPTFGGKPLSMVLVIQMFMLLTGALIIILTKTNPASISKNEVFRSGMIAIVAVYGIAWMAETMFGRICRKFRACWAKWSKSIRGPTPSFCCWSPSLLTPRQRRWRRLFPSRWLSVSIRRISWPLRRHVMATIFCRPTQAIWRRFSLTVPAQPVLAASSLTTASFCRV